MGLIFLIPGIILLATNGWFHDQHVVGEILTWAGAALIIFQILLMVGALAFISRSRKW